jgi:hypothetical protein
MAQFYGYIYCRTTDECQFSSGENMQRLRDCLGTARKCVNVIPLTHETERVIIKLNQNFGNAEMILQQLYSDIAALLLEFSNLVTIKSFGDGADTPQKSILKSLINKLSDYLRIQWAFFGNERDIQFPNLESFLGWINIHININSVVELGDSESQKRERERYPETSIVKKENEIKIMVIWVENYFKRKLIYLFI